MLQDLRDCPDLHDFSICIRKRAWLKVSHDGSVLYIVGYAGRNSCHGEADWRAQRAKKYLSEKHGLKEDRVIYVEGGYRESFSIKLIVTPGQNCGPLPKPTLLRSGVKVEGRCLDKFGGKTHKNEENEKRRLGRSTTASAQRSFDSK